MACNTERFQIFDHIGMLQFHAVIGLDEMRAPLQVAERFQFNHMGKVGKFEKVHVLMFALGQFLQRNRLVRQGHAGLFHSCI